MIFKKLNGYFSASSQVVTPFNHNCHSSNRLESANDYISCLPHDCLIHIFSYLDVLHLSRCGQVSQKFYSISNDNLLWKALYNLEYSHLSLIPPPSRYSLLNSTSTKAWKSVFHRETQEYSKQVENVVPYAKSIYDFLLEKEKHFPCFRYTDTQPYLEPKHRLIVVNWLAEVAHHLNLLPDTYFLTIQILDRFAQKEVFQKEDFQLVGTSALLIASKLEEVDVKNMPSLCLTNLAGLAMTQPTLIHQMEKRILLALSFDFNFATPLIFLRRFSVAARSSFLVHSLSKYILELSTLASSLLIFKPSMIAASSVYIARRMLVPDLQTWTPTLETFSHLTENQLKPCVRHLNDILVLTQLQEIPSDLSIRKPWLKDIAIRNSKRKMKFDFLKRKYTHPSLHRVATITAIPTAKII